jgi:hypothetical protein
LDTKLISLRDQLVNLKISANEDSLTYPPGLDGRLAFLAISVTGASDSAPTESQVQLFERLKKQTDDFLARWDQTRNTDLAAFQKLAADQSVHAVQVPDGKSERVQGESKAGSLDED